MSTERGISPSLHSSILSISLKPYNSGAYSSAHNITHDYEQQQLLLLLLQELNCQALCKPNLFVVAAVAAILIATSNLSKAHETSDRISSSYSQIVLIFSIYFDAIHSWNLRCSHKLQKNTKTPILGVQGHSRSSMLTPIKSVSLLLVMISSMSLHICNHFHTRRANSGKITTF